MAMAIEANDAEPLVFKNYESTLLKSFADMFRKEELTDATLICANRRIRVHKFLLSASSPFFDNIFKMYKCECKIFIKNINYDDLMNALEYIYNGQVAIQPSDFFAFVNAAHKLSIKISDDELQRVSTILGLSIGELKLRSGLCQNNQCDYDVAEIESDYNGNTSSIGLDAVQTKKHNIEIERPREQKKPKNANNCEPPETIEVSQMEFIERMFKARNLPLPMQNPLTNGPTERKLAQKSNTVAGTSNGLGETSRSTSVDARGSSMLESIDDTSASESNSDMESVSVDSKQPMSVRKLRSRINTLKVSIRRNKKRLNNKEVMKRKQIELDQLKEQLKKMEGVKIHDADKSKATTQVNKKQKNVEKQASQSSSKTRRSHETSHNGETSRSASIDVRGSATSKPESVDTFDSESETEDELVHDIVNPRKLRERIHKLKRSIKKGVRIGIRPKTLERKQRRLADLQKKRAMYYAGKLPSKPKQTGKNEQGKSKGAAKPKKSDKKK